MRPAARVLLGALAVAVASTAAGQTLHRDADFAVLGEATTPPQDAPWQHVILPNQWKADRPGETRPGWYSVTFKVSEPGREPWMVYLPRLREGGVLYANPQAHSSYRSSRGLLVDISRAVALHDLDGAMRLILRLHCNRDDDAVALQVIAAFALIQRGAARHGVRLVRPEADLVGVDAARDEIVQHVLRLLQVVHQAYDGFRHFALLGWWKPTSKRDAKYGFGLLPTTQIESNTC